MKFSAEELNIIRQADAIIAGKITTTDFITGADAARSLTPRNFELFEAPDTVGWQPRKSAFFT